MIATASTEEKRALALELGADAAVDPEPEGLKDRLREANGGDRVDVVLEMAGGETFRESFAALARFGRLVAYGNASREAADVSSTAVQQRSRSVIGYWLGDCLTAPDKLVREPLAELFELVRAGALSPWWAAPTRSPTPPARTATSRPGARRASWSCSPKRNYAARLMGVTVAPLGSGLRRESRLRNSASESAIARYTSGCTAIPMWLERTSTCSAFGSRHAFHATMPSVRE